MIAPNVPISVGSRVTVIRREETTRRLGGSGDNFHMSWVSDDRQVVSVCDGMGWLDAPKGMYNSRLFTIAEGPDNATFQDVAGYPEWLPWGKANTPRYYNFGTLALDGRIYQFLSTFNHSALHPDGRPWPDLRFVGAKLIYSPDQGRTWCNQDGSSPIMWEPWERRSRETMVFFEEPQDAFSLFSILQMGRNYEHSRDGYVYVYAPNGNTEGTMNELVMFRVPKAQLLDRRAYEYFAGFEANGTAKWSKDIMLRKPVHTFPSGWVNTKAHPWAWMPSVTYNAPLGLYLMTSWGMGCAPDGDWFGKPSYLGFWMASTPWGPWTQIHEEAAWTPANDSGARAFAPQIAPKWIAADGKSFWLVWSDYQITDAAADRQYQEEDKRLATPTPAEALQLFRQFTRGRSHYAFNTQRVDLMIE